MVSLAFARHIDNMSPTELYFIREHTSEKKVSNGTGI